jgi:hypothetical protein
MAIQKLLPSMSLATMMLVDPTSLFLGLAAPEDTCVLCPLAFSTFLGDQHWRAQCLGLPLHLLHPPALSEWVAVRASSVCPFLPSFPWFWWCMCRIFRQHASSQMAWMSSLTSMVLELCTRHADVRSCKVNHVSLLGMPHRTVLW